MRAVRAETAVGFTTFKEFLERTEGNDREFLAEKDAAWCVPAVCGMANGAGGWIVVGAVLDGDSPTVQGVSDPDLLRARLLRVAEEAFTPRPALSFFLLNKPAPLLLVRVLPLEWNERPISARGDYALGVYRRFEGENFISGLWGKFRLGLDALERLRGETPVKGLSLLDLDLESVAAFREAVTVLRPEWARFSMPDFLSHALVLSASSEGSGAVTSAGNYLLGKGAVSVHVELQPTKLELPNLWRAWALLPRLTASLSEPCAKAFRECFLNALLHADYDAGTRTTGSPATVCVVLSGNPMTARFENPGLPRTWRNGESVCRNFRLMKMFQLFGATRGDGSGLPIIRKYQPDFDLEVDGLELTTSASLALESGAATPSAL